MNIDEAYKTLKAAYADPIKFIRRVWKFVVPGGPRPTDLQEDMMRYVCLDAPDRAILQAFRGAAKSYIVCTAVVWYLLHNRDYQCMLISASKQKAIENANFILNILKRVPELNIMLPDKDQRASVTNGFDIRGATPAQSCSVYSVGIYGAIEGKRADIIIADDVEILNNSATKDMRTKLLYRVNEFESVLKPSTKSNKSKIIYLGTPQTFESVYNELKNKGYFLRIYPAVRPTDAEVEDVYDGRIAPYVMKFDIGQSIEPTRFTVEEFHKRAVSQSYFQLHFMLNCRLSDAFRYPLRVSDLIADDVDTDAGFEKLVWCSDKDKQVELSSFVFNHDRFFSPMSRLGKQVEYQDSIMAVDPSGQGKDETGFAVIKIVNGMVYIVDCGGYQGGFTEDILTALAMTARKHKVNRIILEKNYGGGMFAQLLKPVLLKIHKCSIESVTNSKQKELRIIDILEPLMNQHRLVIDKAVVTKDYKENIEKPDFSLLYQMSHLTRDKHSLVHDDVLDALAMACGFIQNYVGIDLDQVMRDRLEEAYRKDHEKWFGVESTGDRWGDWLK